MTRGRLGLLAASLLALAPAASFAQEPAFRPSDRPIDLPEFAAQLSQPSWILPALELPDDDPSQPDARARTLAVSMIRVTGNTVLPEALLRERTRRYEQRPVSYEQLLGLARELTLLYVREGYVTSGVRVASVRDGRVELAVTEGRLHAVEVTGLRWFRPQHLRTRVRPLEGRVIQIERLEQELQTLQADPRIERIEARLLPGERLGEARLALRVYEDRPFAVGMELSNFQSPGVGGERARLRAAHLNLTGNGDVLDVSYALSSGLDDLQLSYHVPITARGTTLGLRYVKTKGENRELPFRSFDIASRSATYGVELETPLFQSGSTRVSLLAAAEHRTSKTFLGGDGFAFSDGVRRDGVTKLALLRFGQSLTYRDRTQALALASTFTLGLDALDATVGRRDRSGSDVGFGRREPDARFAAWLGRARWARRLPWRSATLIVRADVQLANDPLFSLEQFSVGGVSSVRGYRENQLLRDTGVAASLEVRVPLWQRPSGERALELALFTDWGTSRNRERATGGPQSLASVGIGVLTRLGERMRGELYLAHALRSVPDSSSETDLQDRGIHFRLITEF